MFKKFLDEAQVPGGGTGTKNEDQIVVDAINKIPFRIGAQAGDDADSFKFSVICAKYVKKELPTKIQKFFNTNAFEIVDMINEKGKSLSDSDLQNPGIVYAKLIYNYADYTNEIANFTIPVK